MNLNIAYIEHPPLIGYILYPFMFLFGHTDFAPRIASLLMFFLTGYILYCLVRKLFNEFTALVSVLLLYSVPMLCALEITTDLPYVMFYVLSIFLFYSAALSKKTEYWYLLGFSVGFGLISKYTMFSFFLSMLMYLLMSKKDRFWLKRKEFYFAIFIALVMFLPVFFWNYKNNFVSFWFQISNNMGTVRFHADEIYRGAVVFLQFIGAQFIYYNPVLTFIHRDIIFDIIIKYNTTAVLYGFAAVIFIALLYIKLLYDYFKTKRSEFLAVFVFSFVILAICYIVSFKAFPVEYCTRAGMLILFVYIAFLCSKHIILKIILSLFICFGLFLSVLNPIYFLYGIELNFNNFDKRISGIYNNNLDFIKKYDYAYKSSKAQFGICLNMHDADALKYYLPDHRIVFLPFYENSYDDFYFYLNQNIRDLNGKNAVVLMLEEKIYESLIYDKIFTSAEPTENGDFLFCKNFNFENYKNKYWKYHSEMK